MTEVFTEVIAAFEGSTTRASADVFGLETVINRSDVGFLEFATSALESLSFGSLPLTLTTTFITSMTTTIESGSADPHTLRGLNLALVADGG